MVGLVQKLLFDLIEASAGREALSEVKHRAQVPEDKVFHIGEVYDDDEWRRLFTATCEVLNITPEQAEEVYADFFLKDGLKRWPTWFQMSKNSREFLERQPAIHNSFATGLQDPAARCAMNDKFRLEKSEAELVVHYRSPNRHCGLYKALARWIMKYYGDSGTIEESCCLKKGDPECEIHIRWVQGAVPQ